MRFLKAVEKAEVQVAEAEWPDLRRPDFYINIGDEARVLRRVQLKMLAYAGANALFSHRGVSLESSCPSSFVGEYHGIGELDRKSGVGADARQWIQAISEQVREQRISITESDIARGSLKAKVEYVLPQKSADFPPEVTLTRPAARNTARLVADLLLDEDFDTILYKTLPAKQANERFLNALTPFCYRELLQAAMQLVFGLDWQNRLPHPPVKRGING